MSDAAPSPRIEDVSWGSLRVSDPGGSYKDAKLFPGGSRAWDWNETGTEHVPGVQRADVEELVEKGATTVVLSRGMNRRLRVQEKTVRWLEEQGVEVHVAETGDAVELYNRFRDRDEAVGGLFHTTC